MIITQFFSTPDHPEIFPYDCLIFLDHPALPVHALPPPRPMSPLLHPDFAPIAAEEAARA
jgi:hypothetical protein